MGGVGTTLFSPKKFTGGGIYWKGILSLRTEFKAVFLNVGHALQLSGGGLKNMKAGNPTQIN